MNIVSQFIVSLFIPFILKREGEDFLLLEYFQLSPGLTVECCIAQFDFSVCLFSLLLSYGKVLCSIYCHKATAGNTWKCTVWLVLPICPCGDSVLEGQSANPFKCVHRFC